MGSEPLVCVGEIIAAHGIRGEVKIRCHTDNPEDIATFGALSDGNKRLFKLHITGKTPQGVIARIEGVADRNAAELLVHTKLHVEKKRLPAPAKGSYYHDDLVGLTVTLASGEAFGTVLAVHNFGAGDILEITLAESGKAEMFSFTPATFPVVDVAAGKLVISPPEVLEAAP